MESRAYSRIGEELFHAKLENGLNVYTVPRPGFQKSYAFFAADCGGIDLRFALDGVWRDVPAGTAHFLEHKMFDTEDGNALQDLAANGASPNAFTAFGLTGYYFESTENFYENLKILLSFVSVPYFTPESVSKEQGIIGQEIRMVEDDPGNQVFYAMLEGLYQSHPIRVPIAGTVESISRITADTLYDCHKAFYSPDNMVLCVVGDVEMERVCTLAREILPGGRDTTIQRDYGGEEPPQAVRSRTEQRMEVSTPIFQLGWKADAPPGGEALLRERLVGDLACEALLGSSSPLYARLYADALVNNSFSYGYEDCHGCAFLCAGGESRDPDAVRRAVAQEAERISREGIDEGLFQRLKKAAYGAHVRSLNSFESICAILAENHFAGVEYFRFPEAFDAIEKRDVEECIRKYMTKERSTLAVIAPKEGLK